MKVNDKAFIVTGAGNGIGREITIQLIQKGARVAAIDVNENYLNETKALANVSDKILSIHPFDISDRMAIQDLPKRIFLSHNYIDGLMNVAGIIQPFVKVNELDYRVIDKVININFYGTVYMTKTFLPFLIHRPEAHIVNVSSMGGFLPVPGQSIYGASKAAVKLFTEGLNAELSNTAIHVSIVFPGSIGTQIAQNSKVDVSRLNTPSNQTVKTLTPQKAAGIIIEGMEKNKYRILVGSDAKFMDKLYRLAPEFAKNYIAKKMRFLWGH